MTDKEIIKALECCIEWETPEDCGKCPYKDAKGCVTEQRKDALDLINRQQAEIEKLKKELSTATNHITRLENQIERLLPMLKTKRAEAIKEFAEELKESNHGTLSYCTGWVDFDDIDNLVKEMVGDDK